MQHMDEGVLQAWLDGERGGLSEEERTAVAEHVAECTDCAARVAILRETTESARRILAAPEMADQDLPDFESVVKRSREFGSADPSRRWVAPAWAATVMLAIGVGWMANELIRGPETPAVDAAVELRTGGSADEAPRREMASLESGASGATAPARTVEPPVLAGRVVDAATGQPLESAQVSIPGTGVGALTNREGRFRMPVEVLADSSRRDAELRVDMLGYETESRAVALADGESAAGDIQMKAVALQLQEVVVAAARGPDFWRTLSVEEAEAQSGFSPRTVPGLEVVSLEIGRVDERAVVRVVQTLEVDGQLTMLQAGDTVDFGYPGVQGENEVSTALPEGVFVVARAPLSEGELRALLARLGGR